MPKLWNKCQTILNPYIIFPLAFAHYFLAILLFVAIAIEDPVRRFRVFPRRSFGKNVGKVLLLFSFGRKDRRFPQNVDQPIEMTFLPRFFSDC